MSAGITYLELESDLRDIVKKLSAEAIDENAKRNKHKSKTVMMRAIQETQTGGRQTFQLVLMAAPHPLQGY
jgi:hypothetical protein